MGYFDKVFKSDIHVFLDDVEYSKNGFINRNKILMNGADIYLTIPVSKKYHNSKINEIIVDNGWKNKHIKSLKQSYSKTKYFFKYIDNISEIVYNENKLYKINSNLIRYISQILNCETEFYFSSDLQKKEVKKTDLLLEILNNFSIDAYLSGVGAKDYIEESKFSDIKLIWQDFKHPLYNQRSKKFIKNLSILDLVFNEGENSRRFFYEL